MLRIPGAADNPPPLVLSLRSVAAEAGSSADHPEPGRFGRRKRLSRKADNADWEKKDGPSRGSDGTEKRLMFRWLLAGAAMLSAVVLGIILSMVVENRVKSPIAATSPPSTVSVPALPGHDSPVDGRRSEADFLAEAKPMAKKLMEATRIEELLPLVRNPELAEGRMRRFYPDGKIVPPGMSGFNMMSDLSHDGSIWTVMVSTRDFVEKPLFFIETPKEIKIDWESWAGWSGIPWAEFLATKQSAATLFRVRLSPVEYYNFAFSDDKKWQAYCLQSPDGKHSVYGYVERESRINSKLRFSPEMNAVPLTLLLKFPENATSSNQVIIDKVVTEGWVLETEPPP